MKRLSREERIGAAILAAVTLAVVGCTFFWRMASHSELPVEKIEVVTTSVHPELSDSVDSEDTHHSSRKKKGRGSRSGRKKKSDSEKSASKKSSGSRKSSKEGAKNGADRDLLGEPVPMKQDNK